MKSNESLRKGFKAGALPFLDSLWQTSFCLTRNETKAAELVLQSYMKSYEMWKRAGAKAGCRMMLLKSLAEIFLFRLPSDERMDIAAEDYTAAQHASPEGSSSQNSVPCSMLGKVITYIPAETRLMIILAMHWGLSYGEIADITGIELESVRVKMQSGRLQLRLELAKALSRSGHPYMELIETT